MTSITEERTTQDRTTQPVPAQTRIDKRRTQMVTRRVAVGLGLATVAAIHVLDLPGKFAETPYLGVFYIGLIAAALVIMERLFIAATRLDFIAAAGLAATVIVGYSINRTVGMPGATGDIGNWLEPLGLLSLVVEAFVIWQAVSAVIVLSKKTI
jgi:hypothetical protein